MRIIDKIEEVVQKYKKEFDQIDVEFNKQNEKYKSFLYKDHDFIGRLLKFHLITEFYINEYLEHKYPNVDFNDVDLRYFQKLNMLPSNDYRVAFIKPGLKQLNRIRNKFSHNLGAAVSMYDLNEMLEVLSIARKETKYDKPDQVIEEFTTVACTFLIVSPKEIDDLFAKLFEELV